MVKRVKVPQNLIAGDADEGYGQIADVFRRTMTSGQEIGAAVAVYRDGKKVVDLWGGYRNGTTKEPWREDTMVTVFSTTKGVSSLAIAVAASRGLLSYDAKVGLLAGVCPSGQGVDHRASTTVTPSGTSRH